MKPYEPLKVEHDLITRLFSLVENEISRINNTGTANKDFIDILTDFFVTYVDVAHHGKEENLLFAELEKKTITSAHKNMMSELLEEHKVGRKVINQLIESSDAYFKGDENELKNITARFKDFISLYSKHIDKEDNDYFIQIMQYFTEVEQDELIQKFWRFDIKLIHEKYARLFDLMEGK